MLVGVDEWMGDGWWVGGRKEVIKGVGGVGGWGVGGVSPCMCACMHACARACERASIRACVWVEE